MAETPRPSSNAIIVGGLDIVRARFETISWRDLAATVSFEEFNIGVWPITGLDPLASLRPS